MVRFLGFSKKSERFVEDDNEDYLSIQEDDIISNEVDKDIDVKVFVLDSFENIRNILDVIRNEKTICLIDIHLLRNKDPDELKRSINKLKKTAEAIDGEIVAFHESWIIAAPKNVHIHKGRN